MRISGRLTRLLRTSPKARFDLLGPRALLVAAAALLQLDLARTDLSSLNDTVTALLGALTVVWVSGVIVVAAADQIRSFFRPRPRAILRAKPHTYR